MSIFNKFYKKKFVIEVFMQLYRGMSDLELETWKEERVIPKNKNFTTDRHEAESLGNRHTLAGSLVVVSVPYDDLAFRDVISGFSDGGDWYETDKPIYLGSVPLEILN